MSMINFQQPPSAPITTRASQQSNISVVKPYVQLAALLASIVAVLCMVGSSIYALGQALGHSFLAYIFAAIFVIITLTFIVAVWIDYLPEQHRVP
jgi:cytochrome c biogenesis protein CcdA